MFHLAAAHKTREVKLTAHSQFTYPPDKLQHHIPGSGHHKARVGYFFAHKPCRFNKIVRAFLVGSPAKNEITFLIFYKCRDLVLGVGLFAGDGVMHDLNLAFRDEIIPHNQVFCVLADGYDLIRL